MKLKSETAAGGSRSHQAAQYFSGRSSGQLEPFQTIGSCSLRVTVARKQEDEWTTWTEATSDQEEHYGTDDDDNMVIPKDSSQEGTGSELSFLAMSPVGSDRLQLLWDNFIHAEPQSYEKSSWLDIFLAELLAQVHDGRDIKEILSFCSVGGGGVSTLVACELLSDVHDLCAARNDGGELIELHKYLIQGRGWRSLSVLHLLGVRGLSCGRELVALLVALYPVSSQSSTQPLPPNPYIKFHCNDDTVDTVEIIPHTTKKKNRSRSSTTNEAHVSRKRLRRYSAAGTRVASQAVGHRDPSKNDASSESEVLTDGIDQARSLTLKIRLNPMDFEYFTSVVRSDEENQWGAVLYEPPLRPSRKVPQDFIDDRVKSVLNTKISHFETSLLIIQLLQGLRDYETVPAEQTPAVQVLKFALDTLWSLQFGIDGPSLTGTECATLKAAAARLMLGALERVLRADEPTTAVIHNGLLPMTLRLLEDACSKPVVVMSPEEGSLLQEFIFATTYGIITFLYCLLHQRGTAEKLKDFLELFQLFTESQEGKLVERTILAIVDLPSIDPEKSVTRARKVVDMIGALISALKRVRQELCHMGQCRRSKHRACDNVIEAHHHFDILGSPYSQPKVATLGQQMCCISSLFMTLTGLMRESKSFPIEFEVRLLKVITAAGTCCCFPPKILLANVVGFLKKGNSQIYGPCVVLLERCLFKELGAYPERETCNTCAKPLNYSWEFLELYSGLLSPDDSNLCCSIMGHLVKVTPNAGFHVRRELLFRVFYPTFLSAKKSLERCGGNASTEFIIQSCLSMISSLVVSGPMYERYVEIRGLEESLKLLPNPLFTRNVYALLEVSVIMEIWLAIEENEGELSEGIAVKALLDALDKESTELLEVFEGITQQNIEEILEESVQCAFVKSRKFQEREKSGEPLNKRSLLKTELSKSLEDIVRGGSLEELQKVSLFQASAAWRAAAGVALCSPCFRIELAKSPVSEKSLRLFKILAVCIATDRMKDASKSAHRLLEALITCCLTSPLCDSDVITELGKSLMSAGIKLGRGIAMLVESLLRVSMLKSSREQTMPQPTRPRLPTMTLEALPDCGGEDSSTGEYVTADDGYEADVEVQGKSPQNSLPRRSNSLGPVVEPRGHANAHPALCSLAVDLLIHFSEQGLDGERSTIVSGGLRKVAVICRESASSCAALAGSGVITKLLNGFEAILTSKEPEHQDLQHAVLEVLTLLATQSISPTELVSYLSLFKSASPPLVPLLEPLFRLVIASKPQPNFILSFPIVIEPSSPNKTERENVKNTEKAENLVNNFRKKHIAAEICSPWSVHAMCLPVGPELSWPVWLHGCSASMWLRVERGASVPGRGATVSVSHLLDSDSESLSDWGVLTDNWSREVVAGSASPPAPLTIIHLMSIGFESLVLESWLDLKSDKLILRLTRPDDKTNRTISEASINGLLPSGRWHHLALNFKDTVLNKKSAVVEVKIWVDGYREANAQLPFDGLLVRKPGTTCVLLGQNGPCSSGAWYLGNLMVFRCPIFTKERALYLASLGPNYTNLAECILNSAKPDFSPLIASGALNGVREVKFEGGKFDTSRRKSYGGTYLRHIVETKVSDSKIDWDAVMDATNSHLSDLQDNILISYEAQSPNLVHLYPQAIANPNAVVRTLFPGQPGFRVISAPEHRVSQQPPLSIPPIASSRLECQQYRGLIPAASLIGGMPVFLYLFARVVELNSSEEEQALALSIVLHLSKSDSELLSQYRSEGGPSLLLRVLESPRCNAGKHILKAILDAACDTCILIKDISSGNHVILQNCEAVVTDPELIKVSLSAWRTWAKSDALNLFLQAILVLLRDQHSQREFNAAQFNRVDIVETILLLCKEHFMYEDCYERTLLDPTSGTAVVELIRALMGAPPEFSHLVAITDYLILVHQASETYVTHSRHNIYFLLPPLDDKRSCLKVGLSTTTTTTATTSSSDESVSTLEVSKLNKALANVQIQRDRATRKRERRYGVSKETSAGEDSGIAASDGSNHQISEKHLSWSDEKRVCQGLVCEGLLLLLRDAVRVLPDSQVGSVLKHVLRAEILLVLANNPDTKVRTALVKLVQAYLQRASDEEINKFIKQKYFIHLANQIALYPASEPLAVALESLATRGPTQAAMPPLLAMLSRASATDPNIARPIVSFITDMISKNSSSLKSLLDQGLAESLARSLVGGAHKGNSTSLFNDIHILLVAIATKLLESPGSHHMQAIADLHLILNHVELNERHQCGAESSCVTVIRDAQVVLFDGELDFLMAKVSTHSGFRLRSTASYLASASYLTSVLTTSSEQSDHESRSSSYGSLHGSNTSVREPGRGEINERFKTIIVKTVEFLTTADHAPSYNELQLTKRLFSMLLHGLSSGSDRKYWGGSWGSRPTLRKNTARVMVWLLGPHQSNNTRVYAVRSLMEEPRGREILSSLLEIHAQVEQKFTVFFWDLLEKRDEMPSADARVCAELKEALSIWDLVKGIERATPGLWGEELTLLRRELMRDRDIWMESNLSAIQRIGNKFDILAKQLTESAMTITRTVVEEQNRERKGLMEKLKHSRAMEAQAMARWRDLARRLTHERAPWYFSECYPQSWELDPTEGPARIRIRMQRCHLKIDKRFFRSEHQEKLDAANVESPLSYLFNNVRQDANATALIERLHTSERIRKMSQARVVTPHAELPGEALIGETCLYFVPDKPDSPLHGDIALGGLDLAMAGGTAWRLEDIRELHRRRYQLQERAIEIFLVTGRTYLLAFNSSKERDEFVAELSTCNLPRRVPGDDLGEALALWRSGALTNWEYVMCLNKLAGRSYNDLMQYPVFPFVLADYISERIDLNNSKIYRNFRRPMAVQDKKNEQHYILNYNYLKQAFAEDNNLVALNQGPFHYGSHYSNSGTVLHFLVRLPPFTSMFLCYQDNNFDIPDRTFHALATTWRLTSCDSTTDVKELIPEFFYLPEFLLNSEGFNFGVRQNGQRVGDVELPPWCGGDARLFILAHRAALEADIVREVLPYWIDLVFGFRQTGRPAIEAINVFHPATYYGFNVDQIEDPSQRDAWETMVKTYGQTPAQLFRASHPLPIPSALSSIPASSVPPVIEGVDGIKWGNYVGAPGNEPVLCWKNKHRAAMASLIPLSTGDVFGLPVCTTLLLRYTKEKGTNMLSGTSVLGAALASWSGSDGIARLKCKKEQPPRPLIKSSGYDPITILGSAADCGQLWIGHLSGRITVHSYNVEAAGKIEFGLGPASVLLAHRCAVRVIALSRAFSIAVTGDDEGVIVVWDLNSLSYVRSIVCDRTHTIGLLSISETLGDIAVTCELKESEETGDNRSELRVYTINARAVGAVLSKRRITALCYSNAPEGVSVNVIATGLDNGVIRLWSSWDLRLVREIVNGGRGCGAIIAIAWALDQHHLYAATEDSTVLIWEGMRRLSNGTPKFVNLTSL
ncbi:lysosomal-trafficking regulator [Diachasma alloeum]|uniref:lysosomal-trafficking regulator n=1 Tax=Diachasma alloeum TaxID=454923 RepID=UPI00073832C2|nr:lysosomal-trafficking regulator [Diachasma alloeum]